MIVFCCCRRVRVDGLKPHRESAGEVAVRPRGVRPDSVSRAADALRQAAAAAAVAEDRLGTGHRAAVLRAPRRQDADRHPHPGHVAQRQLIQLALHAAPVIIIFCDLLGTFR